MVSKVLLSSVLAASSVSAAVQHVDFNVLIARQAVGTPAYNCHNNCGQAILFYRAGGSYCNNEGFKTDYNNCLQCSGPDNEDIWKYYGTTLTIAGTACGLSTTPLSGDQADVGDAVVATTSSSAAAASTAASSAPASSTPAATSAAATSSAVATSAAATSAAPASSTAAATSAAATSAAATSAAGSTRATSAASSAAAGTKSSGTAAGSTVATATSGSKSGVASGTGVATGTSSSITSVVTAGAANGRPAAAGLAGIMALGAVYAAVY